jgi:hypothetical protein
MTFGLKIITSNFAVKQDGTEPKEIQVERGGFWARLFDPDPTLPLWQKTKTKVIQVPRYKPVMYKMADQIICHPSLFEQLRKAMDTTRKPSDVFRW